jgi:hypothetical protein
MSRRGLGGGDRIETHRDSWRLGEFVEFVEFVELLGFMETGDTIEIRGDSVETSEVC